MTPHTATTQEMCECGATIKAGSPCLIYDIGGGAGYACIACAAAVADQEDADEAGMHESIARAERLNDHRQAFPDDEVQDEVESLQAPWAGEFS